MSELQRIFLASVRLYFAPIVGAVKQVKFELARIERERATQGNSNK